MAATIERAPSSPPVIVVNPASAGGATRRRWPELEAALRGALGELRPQFTEHPGHATELTRAALRGGARLVAVIGGDGTINEAVNGFFDEGGAVIAPDAALGLLPMGTGGDFVKTTRTPRDIAAAARALAEASPRPVDVGRLSFVDHDGRPAARHFINIASFGISGLVDRYVNRSSKALGGRVSFAVATLQATARYRNPRCRITVDGRPLREQGIYTCAVANGRFFGGGMMVAPGARLDDGSFDVIVIGDVGMTTMLRHGLSVYRGTHVTKPFVTVEHGRMVVAEPVDPNDEVLLDVDGEAPGRLPATFELVPAAIRVVY